MIDITYKKRGLRINAIWFCDDPAEAYKNSSADIVFFHGTENPGLKGSIIIPQKTMITDFDRPLKDIFGSFGSSCRNRIHKAEREDMTFTVHDAEELISNPELLISFKNEYAEFTSTKGIENSYNEAAMEEYIKKGAVLLTKVTKDGVYYAQHISVTDGRHTRGLYSVSRFRDAGLDKKITGNVNRYLHWREITYLYDCGFTAYDWGGISSETAPNGVDRFKMEFHGRICQYDNVIAGKTLKGKTVIFLLKRSGKKLFAV